jgi:hypothetical protein
MSMRRALLLAGVVAGVPVICTPTAVAARSAAWSAPQQRLALREGMLQRFKDGRFHGERSLTRAQLRSARDRIAARFGTPAVPIAGHGRISVAGFHRVAVRQLGLADVAAHVQEETARAGLRPPSDFGTEVIARWLELRYNHPEGRERDEPFPWSPISRAEAAYSLAKIARMRDGAIAMARERFSAYALPRYTPAQKRVLRRAVARIGMPYIWGGTSDTASGQAHGGYDCSGLVWRALRGLRHAPPRTNAATMARGGRHLRLGEVHAADVVFLKWQGAIYHTGLALSPDWVIHSADQGVHVLPLTTGWFHEEFAWARRFI